MTIPEAVIEAAARGLFVQRFGRENGSEALADEARAGNWPMWVEAMNLARAALSASPLMEVVEALRGMVAFGEEVERKRLVGHEGCFWPVEIARDALSAFQPKESDRG